LFSISRLKKKKRSKEIGVKARVAERYHCRARDGPFGSVVDLARIQLTFFRSFTSLTNKNRRSRKMSSFSLIYSFLFKMKSRSRRQIVRKQRSRRRVKNSKKASKRSLQRKTKSRKASTSRRLKSNKGSKTILMIGADWCPYCRNAKPHFTRLSKLYSSNINSKYIDVDTQPSIAAMYRAKTIPTFVFLENKQVVHKYNESDPARLKKEFETFVLN
jgi:thiol-disulfide isomerase/thioredoxin